MTTYKVVPAAPKSLGENEMVMYKPTFIEEINKTKPRRGVTRLTTASSLRDIFMAITDKYDPTVNPYHLKLNKYEGIKYEKDEDLTEIVYRVIRDNDLKLIDAAVDKLLKSRSPSVETIYYVTDDLQGVSVFIKNGVSPQKDEKKTKKPEKTEDVV